MTAQELIDQLNTLPTGDKLMEIVFMDNTGKFCSINNVDMYKTVITSSAYQAESEAVVLRE